MPFIKTERGGLVNTRHIQHIVETDTGAFAVMKAGLEAIEIDTKFYCGFMLDCDFQTVCLLLEDSE